MRSIRQFAARGAWACAALLAAALPAQAQTQPPPQVTVYQVPALSGFTGVFAAVMPALAGAREGVINWWNAEHGSKIGIKLDLKAVDVRYDTAETASLWPGILANMKPVVGLALGGPDTAALQQRLPNDKVPMILGSAVNGFGWRSNQWIMATRPTFVHEIAGFLEWFQKNRVGGNRPVKFAMFTTEASPSFADMGKGVVAYAKANPKMVELVEMVYVEAQPADLTLQLRRVLNAGAEVILVPSSVQQAVAVKRAMQALGKNVPIMYNAHNSTGVLAGPLGGWAALEGDYEAHGTAVTSPDDSEAKRFYDLLTTKYGMKAPWHTLTGLGIAQTLVLVRTVEAAARKYGPDKLTGELVYKTLLETTIPAKDLFGYTGGDVDFSVEAAFPSKDPRVNIGQVTGGKLKTVAQGVPAPKLAKW